MRDFVQNVFDACPEPTPLMEQINQESETLLASVQELQNNIAEKQSALEPLKSQLETEIEALKTTIEEQQAAIESEISEQDSKTNELKDALQAIKDETIAVLEAAQDQMSQFEDRIDSGRDLVESANTTAQAAIGEIHGRMDKGRELLVEATDTANANIDALQVTIDETLQLTETVATDMIDQVDQGIRDTGAKVEEMVGVSFADLESVFTAGMEMVQGNVIESGVNMALDELQTQIEGQLNEIIASLVAQLVETLGRVRESLFGNAEESSLERKALEPILDQLDSILDPLFSAVDSIKGMAEMVGISV